VIGINFFITLAVSGVMNTLFLSNIPYKQYLAYLAAVATIGFYVLYTQLNGVPSYALVGDASATDSFRDIFVLGLIAGCVTFGGAYTTLPFIYAQAVTKGGWLTDKEFLDALAITNVMPTPLVSFVTMVGWFGNGPIGSILMTIGIFLPAFSFTIIGHKFFEEFVHNPVIEPFLDGVSSAVIGLLLFTAFQFLLVVKSGIDACVFLLSMAAIFTYKDKYTQPVTIAMAAIAGQVLYRT
jgi:chromate transporter